MSKILEAMRRSVTADKGNFDFHLATMNGVVLFPPPPAAQMIEFERLGNALISHQGSQAGQVAVFASTSSGEGTSYVSYNVARQLSFMIDRKVAWIDANFRSPQVALPADGVTFRGLLQDPALFAELRTTGKLVVVPNGDQPIKPTDYLNSENYLALLKLFQRNFYFTIIDAPPILESVDVAHLAGPTLGLVLVVESRRLKHEVIRHGLASLTAQNVTVLGTVLNKRVFDIPDFLYKKL